MAGPEQGIALDSIPAAASLVDRAGTVVDANERWLAAFACGRGELIGAPLQRCFPEEEDIVASVASAQAEARGRRVQARRLNGVPFTADLDAALAGERMLCLLREARGEAFLSDAQRYLDAAFEAAPTATALCNTDGEYVRVNAAMCRMLGLSAEGLVGRRDQLFTHPDDRERDVEVAWRILDGEFDEWQTEKRFLAADGSVVWVIANLAFLRDEEGRPLCWFAQFQDITERKSAERELRHQAEHDELTGLGNRRRLVGELERRLSLAERGALLVLDLDGFKQVNDSLGHTVGDAVLVEVAQALQARVRQTDLVARLGGDEFAIVLPDAQPAQAEAVADDLAAAVGCVRRGALSASCGIAYYAPGAPRDPQRLIELADAAMYEAKGARRGAVQEIR